MNEFTYTVVRSRRKTLGLEIRSGRVIVRAPLLTPDEEIRRLLREKAGWIAKHLRRREEALRSLPAAPPLTREELYDLADRALKVIPERVRHFAPLVGVRYGRITIRNQRTRWGSCSGKGNLNFNCLLLLTPPEVLDSVVVHELCHLKEMNHSPRFYAEVYRVCPDYDRWNAWLKDHGAAILARMDGTGAAGAL